MARGRRKGERKQEGRDVTATPTRGQAGPDDNYYLVLHIEVLDRDDPAVTITPSRMPADVVSQFAAAAEQVADPVSGAPISQKQREAVDAAGPSIREALGLARADNEPT